MEEQTLRLLRLRVREQGSSARLPPELLLWMSNTVKMASPEEKNVL